MAAKTYSTKELLGTRVVGGKKGTRRIGKVRRFVFHPTEKRCVGFIVKRPDLLLMFRRADLFVPLDGFEMEDGRVRLPHDMKQGTGAAACKRLGLDWDSCTLWEGMPVLSESGRDFGVVGDVVFMRESGRVVSVQARRGSLDKALLGDLVVPANLIRGFRLGVGSTVLTSGRDVEGEERTGAILVDDAVSSLQLQGGAAEAAGRATARIGHQAKQAGEAAKSAAAEAAEVAAPAVHEAAKVTGKAVNTGAYALGRQLGRSKNMFKNFKDEFDKASRDDG